MSKVFIEESTLSSIGNAIREKNGTTELIAPLDMGAAIAAIEAGGGGYMPTDEELTFNSWDGLFANGKHAWIVREFGNKFRFINTYNSASNAFSYYPYKVFDANLLIDKSSIYIPMSSMFSDSEIEEITGSIRTPEFSENTTKYTDGYYTCWNIYQMFDDCHKLRKINDNFIDTEKVVTRASTSSNDNRYSSIFYDCYSLRELPKWIFKLLDKKDDGTPITLRGNEYGYSYNFMNCYALNKIENLWIFESLHDGSIINTSSLFYSAFSNCGNLHKLTFKTNADGTPLVAKWNNVLIDLSQYVGYANGISQLTSHNSGLTDEGQVMDLSKQPYKDDTINDYFTYGNQKLMYAKYGHMEAVETINSLPDTSAVGGTNTIKFKGAQGQYTDYLRGRTDDTTFDSSINTLTEAEIAVAAAKGWTVTLV